MEDQGISWGLPLFIKARVKTSAYFCYVSEDSRAMQPCRLRESRGRSVHLARISQILIRVSVRGNKPVVVKQQIVPMPVRQLGGLVILRGQEFQVGQVVKNNLPLHVIQGDRQLSLRRHRFQLCVRWNWFCQRHRPRGAVSRLSKGRSERRIPRQKSREALKRDQNSSSDRDQVEAKAKHLAWCHKKT